MTTTTAQRVAATVRAEMARRKITQTAAASGLGMSQAALSRRLTGVTPFDVEELSALADLLGVSTAMLVGDAA